MTAVTPASGEAAQTLWYPLSPDEVATRLGVDPARGLSEMEVDRRRQQYGSNVLAAKKAESPLQAFLRQYQDLMQIILVGAAIVNQVVTGELGTTVVLLGLTVFNAVLGLRQEAKAEASLAALEKMLKDIARVRRDGVAVEIDAAELVPGDVVLFEAGNRVPADGRLLVAATLEIEEAALTGESAPVLKDITPIEGDDVGLGDQVCLAFMNTSVTRGRGEMIVTGTGMDTQIGRIATLLNQTEADKTPLQKQLDRLTQVIVGIAGVAFVIMVLLGLQDDLPFDDIFLAGVALAISAIPTGLPAVVTTLYSMGTRVLAEHNAIVKRLPSVETLGSVSAICSDKTGTLTLNKMTAREMVVPGRNRFTISGEGYATTGEIKHEGGLEVDLDEVLLPMALCADARLDDAGDLIGDPTEGALIVLAAKGGIDLDGARERHPRVAEVPFDSEYKFMATFHNMTDRSGRDVVRCFLKGAPDVLIDRSTSFWSPDGEVRQIAGEHQAAALAENERMAKSGHRVMVVARRDFDPATFDPSATLLDDMHDLTIIAMVGIVDPPRAEARDAIAKCHSAGIEVRMITGDHAVTAAAIGKELGIGGRALTGAEFAALTDEELAAQLPEIGVVARVAPEDKIRLVHALQEQSNIVSMTGDGVNDAPALKAADIGVAMGITGTEVSKDAAVMILTDDNFATIVRAVEYGRELYDNLSKYIRFQMAALVGFIATFLGAAIFSIADGIPFSPLAVLWINFVVQVPIAIALGFDKPLPGLMARKPRPLAQPVLNVPQWVRAVVLGLLIAAATLFVREAFEDWANALVATTMAVTTFSLMNVTLGMCARSQTRTMFTRDIVSDRRQLTLYGGTIIAIILATELDVLNRVLDTTPLTGGQWLVCVLLALALVAVEEIVKVVLRSREPAHDNELDSIAA
ncbi:MAG TPA: cation-translocating P-type ATPase [Microthrixaceae bacterium]|nr:cation-translocating P-type ATPase [Microthrixaceae bacterium]